MSQREGLSHMQIKYIYRELPEQDRINIDACIAELRMAKPQLSKLFCLEILSCLGMWIYRHEEQEDEPYS